MNIAGEMRINDICTTGMNKGVEDISPLENNVLIQCFDKEGNLKDQRAIHNAVSTVGKYIVADQLLATPTYAKPGWMELGTGTPGATKLGAYIAGSRTALSAKTRTDNVVTMVCTFAAGVGTGAVTEAGVFNVVTEDTADMCLYTNFAVINKAATDSITITWTLTIN